MVNVLQLVLFAETATSLKEYRAKTNHTPHSFTMVYDHDAAECAVLLIAPGYTSIPSGPI